MSEVVSSGLEPEKIYYETELVTSWELAEAAQFDHDIFSVRRREFAAEDVAQPTVDSSAYERIVERGGRVVAYRDRVSHEIIALCSVALAKDPLAHELMLQNLPPDMAYMTMAGVREDHRGKGWGRRLLDKRLSWRARLVRQKR